MRVLFVLTNVDGDHASTYPFGLASIGAVLKKHGIDFDYYCLNTRDTSDFMNVFSQPPTADRLILKNL